MPHIFDPEKAGILDSEERKRIEPADVIIEIAAKVERRNTAVEIGAGTGYYTIPLSKIFKKVYAVDLSFKMAEKMSEKLLNDGIKNVGIIVSDKPPDLDFPIDLVLFANVLHEIDNPRRYIEWAWRSDYILIVDWKKIDMPFGPPFEERIGKKDMIGMLKGFEIKIVSELPYHYLIFAKSSSRNRRKDRY